MLAHVPSPVLAEWMAAYRLDSEEMEAAMEPEQVEDKQADLKNKIHFMHALYGGNLEVS